MLFPFKLGYDVYHSFCKTKALKMQEIHSSHERKTDQAAICKFFEVFLMIATLFY
jgi:hypothetical protein